MGTSRTLVRPVVLYLDFDGVLHAEHVYRHPRRGIYLDQRQAPGHSLFEWAPLLEDALQVAPAVAVVLSTSWVRELRFSRALKRLPPAIARRVIGATYHSEHHGRLQWQKERFAAIPRGIQILRDVERRQPVAWRALDDEVAGWPAEHLDKLIACDGNTGISAPAVLEQLREHLTRLQAAA